MNNINSETESEIGEKDIPNGGFPPIYICNRVDIKKEEENKNREYSTHKTAVTIKQIMESRKLSTPFI